MAQGNSVRRTQYTLDTLLELHDGAANITADGAGQVGGSAKIIDLGGGDQATSPLIFGEVQVDITTLDITTGDETYVLSIQGSSSPTFASDIAELAALRIGDGSAIGAGIDTNDLAGRYVIGFANEKNGNTYRYLRLYFDVTGTTPIFAGTAYLAKRI